eukprot:3411755-Prymnesium_polylepis.1
MQRWRFRGGTWSSPSRDSEDSEDSEDSTRQQAHRGNLTFADAPRLRELIQVTCMPDVYQASRAKFEARVS